MGLEQILFDILSISTQIRQSAQTLYHQLLQHQPQQTLLALLNQLDNPQQKIGHLSAILLKSALGIKNQYYQKASQQTQSRIKECLFGRAIVQTDQTLRRLLCDTVGQLSISIFNRKQEWLQICPGLYLMLQREFNISYLQILSQIIPNRVDFLMEYLERIYHQLVQAVNAQELKIRLASLQVFLCIFSVVDENTEERLGLVAPKLMKSLQISLQYQQDCNRILGKLIQIAEVSGVIFAVYFQNCLNISEFICNSNMEIQSKLLVLEFTIAVAQSILEIQRKAQSLRVLVNRVYMVIVSTQDISQYAQEGVDLIFRIIQICPQLKSELSLLIRDTLTSQDWRMIYMAISTLQELLTVQLDHHFIKTLFSTALIFSNSQNPDLQDAIFILISKLSPHNKEIIQLQHVKIVKILVQALQNNNINCFRALSAIFRCFPYNILSQYNTVLLRKIVNIFQQSLDIDLLTEAAKIVRLANCLDYYDQIINHLFSLLHKYQGDIYKLLRETSSYSICAISLSVSKYQFMPYFKQLVFYIKNLQQAQTQQGYISVYILKCWQALTCIMGVDCASELENIVPELLKLVAAQSSSKLSVKILQTILCLVKNLKGSFNMYIDMTIRVIFPLVSQTLNQQTRSLAALILAYIVVSRREVLDYHCIQNSVQLAKAFIQKLVVCSEEEFVLETATMQLKAIALIIQAPTLPFLSADEVSVLISKTEAFSIKTSISYIQEDKDYLQIKDKKDWAYLQSLAGVFKSLFVSHPNSSVQFIHTAFLHDCLSTNSHYLYKRFALLLMKSMLQHLTDLLQIQLWDFIVQSHVQFSSDQKSQVRKVAILGLFSVVKLSGKTYFQKWTNRVMLAMKQVIELPQFKEDLIAVELSVGVLGCMIQYQYGNLDLYGTLASWIQMLPIRENKELAIEMHRLLVQIVLNRPEVYSDPNRVILGKVLEIFGEVLETELVDQEVPFMVQEILYKLSQGSLLHQVWMELTPRTQLRLNKLINQWLCIIEKDY